MLKKGQSQLDYLWVNYGNKYITNDPLDTNENAIPSLSLMLSLLEKINSLAINSLIFLGNYLIGRAIDGSVLCKLNISGLSSIDVYIVDFGKREVTYEDIENGCHLPLGTEAYYIKLSDGSEYLAQSDKISGGSTYTIENRVVDNVVYSDLKISENSGNVILSKDKNGLKASVNLDNYYDKDTIDSKLGKFVVTSEDVNNIITERLTDVGLEWSDIN